MTDNNDIIVSSYDIMKDRTPTELKCWIDEVFSEAKDEEQITAIRLRSTDNIKVLLEEVIPISHFSNRYFDKDVKIKPIIGNQSFDAEVLGSNNVKYIEVTRAIDGYDEKLRNEHLDIHGSVSAVGSISINGTKASGKREVVIHSEAVNHKDTIKKIKELIIDRIQKKVDKQDNYNDGTLLLVSFDDSFFWDEDKTEIDTFINEKIKTIEHSFISIAIIGTQDKYYSVL